MNKAEEATNDFCTRCFKYRKCHKVQSECTMADSYQEGYEDGYRQAEKDSKLSWKDIANILNVTDVIANDDSMEKRLKTMSEEEYCQEILKRFKAMK